MLRAGIVGLPNVGKSTLFNAVTRTRKAASGNFPFCTIDPNVGIVNVPDDRLAKLSEIAKTNVIIPAAIEFVDIAGLVKGAAEGEGLGNKFLTNIRETDAIIQVVRCFDDDDIHHVDGSVDPIRDIETINTELILADMESASRQNERLAKEVKRGNKDAIQNSVVLEKLIAHMDSGKPVFTADLDETEKAIARTFFLLTAKPTLFAANVREEDLKDPGSNVHVQKVTAYARDHHGCETVVISAQIESDLVDLSPQEAAEFLTELGVQESGVGSLIKAAYHLLGLRTYFTAGEKEVRAWTIHEGDTAPQAAGVIHSDFERAFIKAETVSYDDLISCGSVAVARDKGLYRIEGKEYIVKDGDVMHFRTNA